MWVLIIILSYFRINIPFRCTLYSNGTIHGLAFWFDVSFVGSQYVLHSHNNHLHIINFIGKQFGCPQVHLLHGLIGFR